MKLNIYFYLAFAYITLYGCFTFFLNKEKILWPFKILLVVASIVAVFILVWYQIIEKQEQKYSDFIAGAERRDIARKIEDLKEKEKKGLLTNNDYSLYIARYLESIDHTLKYSGGKNKREWIATYYEAVEKIPEYFNFEEWKESEKLIYSSMVNEINGHFNMRGTFNSGMRPALLEVFARERERLLQAKEREFNK